MPHRSLTQEDYDNFPYRDARERLAYIRRLEDECGPMTEEQRTSLVYRLPLGHKLKILEPVFNMGETEALKLCGQPLDDSHYDRDMLLDQTGMITAPSERFVKDGYDWSAERGFGPTVCILLKNAIPQSLLNEVRDVVRKAATQRKVAGGNRGVAAGTGMVARKRKDGSTSKIKGAQKLQDLNDEDYARLRSATDGLVGYSARSIRGGQLYPCRLTHYSGALPVELALMGILAKTVGEAFKKSFMQDRWEKQFAKAQQTAPTWLIKSGEGITPFTTITCNRSWRTAAHVDKGDLKEGFGVLCCLGDFEGCDLVFPRYRVAVRFREGDVLLANVHQVHGNTPLLNPDGSVPEVGREPERLSCVFYYQEKMEQCKRTDNAEKAFINKRERGESTKKKAKAKGAGR
jgi:hypothetical protein